MASITFKKVVKQYEGAASATVKGIDLHINDKEFVVLVGPSGCGKSTSLRMVAGLEDITAGEIMIGDVVVNNLPPKDRDIAMVFQNYALYPHMNVRENMSFGLKLRHFPQPEIDRRVQDAAKILGLVEYLDRLPKQLSGGQRQRVALGRAIVRDPKVFLMDEPLSNLDAKLRVQMRAEIKKLHQRLHTTFVYVTHDQVEAMTMADRIVLLHNGIIQQYDEPGVIYERPANTFVATFIGSPPMNLLKVKRTANGLDLPHAQEGKAHSWEVGLAGLFKSLGSDDSLVMGIRPEHILIDGNKGGPSGKTPAGSPEIPSLSLPCQVDLIEPMGAETYLYLTGHGHTLNARVDPNVKVEVGQTVTAQVPLALFHLFDEKTTERLPRKEEH